MIRFKCVYCGQRILAPDNGAGKRGKCPKCAHHLVVPESTKGRPAISVEKTEPMPQPKAYVPEWDKDLYPSFDAFDERGEDSTELFKERFGFLIPAYDSLSVFFMAITWVLFLVTNPKTQEHFLYLMSYFPTEYPEWNMLAAGLAFLVILVICFYMVFTKRDKTNIEKYIMAFFAVITAIITASASGIYLIDSHNTFDWRIISDWQIIFPLWNLFNARILLHMLYTGIINEDCVSDRQAKPLQIFLGLTVVIAIFLFCNYTFKLYWAITFSICIIYTTSFDRAIQNVFPDLTGQEIEVSRDKV